MNKVKARARKKRYYEAHKDTINAGRRKCPVQVAVFSPELVADWTTALAWRDRERRLRASHRKDALKNKIDYEWIDYISRWQELGELCYQCHKHVDFDKTWWHHFIPKKKPYYGPTMRWNLVPLHGGCNYKLHASDIGRNGWLRRENQDYQDWLKWHHSQYLRRAIQQSLKREYDKGLLLVSENGLKFIESGEVVLEIDKETGEVLSETGQLDFDYSYGGITEYDYMTTDYELNDPMMFLVFSEKTFSEELQEDSATEFL